MDHKSNKDKETNGELKTNVNLHSTTNTKCVGGLYNTNKLSIETQGREIIASMIDEELWNRKVWKPPSECMNRDKEENKRMRNKIKEM